MKYIAKSKEIEYTVHNIVDGTIEFRLGGVLYRSVGQATFDNSPNNNYSTYSAPLVCPEDAEYPNDTVGKVEWDIINPETEDESEACDWDKFDIYLDLISTLRMIGNEKTTKTLNGVDAMCRNRNCENFNADSALHNYCVKCIKMANEVMSNARCVKTGNKPEFKQALRIAEYALRIYQNTYSAPEQLEWATMIYPSGWADLFEGNKEEVKP